MNLDRRWIAAHIAHQGSMCLLEEVLSWDSQQLACRAGNHRAADHPLRAHGRLGSACAIEYAAQAVAVHGALLQALPDSQSAHALRVLASARALELCVGRLDDLSGDLLISVLRLHAEERSALYSFELNEAADALPGTAAGALPGTAEASAAGAAGIRRRLAHGRLSLWLDISAGRGRGSR